MSLSMSAFAQNALDRFLISIEHSSDLDREAMMKELRSKVCIECGAPDPDCPCWERDEAIPS